MTRIIEVDGEPFAMLIESEEGTFLSPPIVFDSDLNMIEGFEIAEALRLTGAEIESTDGGIWTGHTKSGAPFTHPVLLNRTVGDLARIDQQMANISRELGVPIL